MSLIDSNNFITHLVWSGLVDNATCGQLKEAIELCKVDAIPKSVIEDIKEEIEQTVIEEADEEKWARGLHYALKIIDKHCGKENIDE